MRVRLIEVRHDGKLSFSMREANRRDDRSTPKLEPKIDEYGRRIGAITGILIDDLVMVGKRQEVRRIDRENSPDMWERKQLKGANVLHLVSDKPKEEELEESALVEEYTELELNKDNAPFLRGHAERIAQENHPVTREPAGSLLSTAKK